MIFKILVPEESILVTEIIEDRLFEEECRLEQIDKSKFTVEFIQERIKILKNLLKKLDKFEA